ncbi:hypothetical protein [Aquimarina aggregata]|uniref:hypothetical protein n=1 Tax=Aquimarina aggregata TaxID=1642818 RepID=UPI002490E340|nr:hypothetical protein [Aquimarina aggregata]
MKKNKKLLLGLILMVAISSFAQEYKFGEVSKEELLETSYPFDKSANAAVLFEKKKIYYDYDPKQGFVLTTEVFKRIKLYTKNGFGHASEELFLYQSNGTAERVSGLSGVTYSLAEDGSVIETKLKNDGIFKTEVSGSLKKMSFTMPALTKGSIIEYKYKILSPFSRSIDRILLQYDIPIKKIKVSLAIPEYYTFRKRTAGFLPINIRESSDRQSDMIYSQRVDYNVTKYDISAQQVTAFKKEPYSGNYMNYVSALSFELQSVQFPYSTIQNYASTWGGIAKGAFKNSRFGGAMNTTKYFKKDVDQLISGVSDPMKKMNLIYDYVKEKMTWNDRFAVMPRKNMKKVYEERVGSAAEINLMLIAMLKYAKVNVKPILVSSSNKALSLFPTLQGLDYVVARVKVNEDVYFLDATDKYGEPNVLPDRVVQGLGRLITERGDSDMVMFRPSKVSLKQNVLLCQIEEDGNIKGKQRVKYTSYEAHDFRVQNASKKEEEHIKRLKSIYGIQNISEYKVDNVENIGEAISESFAFEVSDEIEVIEDEMFFSPLLFLRNKENVFKSDERKYPVDLRYGFSNSYSVNIKIPEGYTVAEKPEDVGFQLPEKMGSFVFRMTIVGDMIQLFVSETVSSPLITEQYYSVLKEFYGQLIKKESDQVVLKKV